MGPSEQYSERLAARERSQAGWDRWHARLGHARLVIAAAFLILALAWGTRGTAGQWLLVPSALFAAALLYHHRVQKLRALARRAVHFYRTGLERWQEQRPSGGPAGDRFNDQHHVYGADLDLFGKQSLFERLSTVRTSMGESTLAGWLLAPADLGVLSKRPARIPEL